MLYFIIFGEHKSGSGEPWQSSLVEMVRVDVVNQLVIVSLGLSVASCFLSLATIKIFQTTKAKLTIIKKNKHIASTFKYGVNSKINV